MVKARYFLVTLFLFTTLLAGRININNANADSIKNTLNWRGRKKIKFLMNKPYDRLNDLIEVVDLNENEINTILNHYYFPGIKQLEFKVKNSFLEDESKRGLHSTLVEIDKQDFANSAIKITPLSDAKYDIFYYLQVQNTVPGLNVHVGKVQFQSPLGLAFISKLHSGSVPESSEWQKPRYWADKPAVLSDKYPDSILFHWQKNPYEYNLFIARYRYSETHEYTHNNYLINSRPDKPFNGENLFEEKLLYQSLKIQGIFNHQPLVLFFLNSTYGETYCRETGSCYTGLRASGLYKYFQGGNMNIHLESVLNRQTSTYSSLIKTDYWYKKTKLNLSYFYRSDNYLMPHSYYTYQSVAEKHSLDFKLLSEFSKAKTLYLYQQNDLNKNYKHKQSFYLHLMNNHLVLNLNRNTLNKNTASHNLSAAVDSIAIAPKKNVHIDLRYKNYLEDSQAFTFKTYRNKGKFQFGFNFSYASFGQTKKPLAYNSLNRDTAFTHYCSGENLLLSPKIKLKQKKWTMAYSGAWLLPMGLSSELIQQEFTFEYHRNFYSSL